MRLIGLVVLFALSVALAPLAAETQPAARPHRALSSEGTVILVSHPATAPAA